MHPFVLIVDTNTGLAPFFGGDNEILNGIPFKIFVLKRKKIPEVKNYQNQGIKKILGIDAPNGQHYWIS